MVKLFAKLKGSADRGTTTQNNAGFIRVVPEKEEELRRTAEAKIKQASLYLTSDPQKAVGLLSEVLATFPNHFGAYINRGIAHSHLGEKEKAAEDYQRSIAINPRFYVAHINLAALYKEEGKKEEALKLYKTVLAMIPPERKEDRTIVQELIDSL